jgi:hypothetical protein
VSSAAFRAAPDQVPMTADDNTEETLAAECCCMPIVVQFDWR